MLYRVRAQPISREIPLFWKILNDGTIERQQPDGMEIIASMKRAVKSGDTVEWYETCYCSPPLKHERSTVYDRFFTNIQTEHVLSVPELTGARFWNYLEGLQGKNQQ
jgi:hypothetical protein